MFPNWVLTSLALVNQVACFPVPIGMKSLKKQWWPGLALELTGFFFRALLAWKWEYGREKARGSLCGVCGMEGGLLVHPSSPPHLWIIKCSCPVHVFLLPSWVWLMPGQGLVNGRRGQIEKVLGGDGVAWLTLTNPIQ